MTLRILMNKSTEEKTFNKRSECGAALAVAVIVIAILAVVALTALAFSSTEARIAGSDLQRTQTFYATVSALEKMTNDFSNLFRRKMHPTPADLDIIKNSPPTELEGEGFYFQQTLEKDTDKLTQLQAIQGLPNNVYPRVNIPEGPYSGLYASLIPYKMSSIATQQTTGTQVKLEREFNNYLVPLFQFGIYSNEDIEVSPGPMLTFNGRVHANGNIYALRNTKFLNRLTMAGEWVREASRGGEPNTDTGSDNVWIEVDGINVKSTKGSVQSGSGTVGGPFIAGSTPGTRGYHPGSPNGVANPKWEAESVKSAKKGTSDRFGGKLVTNSTGASKLATPLELAGNSPAEIIKRELPSDDEILSGSRYHSKSQVRILIDDETAGSGSNNVAGIPANKGVLLSNFTPSVLNDGKALYLFDDNGSISPGNYSNFRQKEPGNLTGLAKTVRGIKFTGEKDASGNYIPPGAGIQGKILIEIVNPDGTTVDVTQTILSMGVTVGEPNGIIYLQRPLWAAYIQGSRDRAGNGFNLVDLTQNSQSIADGEIADPSTWFFLNRGFINTTAVAADEDSGIYAREATPSGHPFNQIVPINVYNVREGWYRSQMSESDIYERGITSVVEINMRNLARWLDGIYDTSLLSGTNALSSNIKGDEGYVVYISDRRGDKVKTEYLSSGAAYKSTNGIVDNEDIYGPNNALDAGEDVIDFGWEVGGSSKKGSLQRDLNELPTLGKIWSSSLVREERAREVLSWSPLSISSNSYFRRGVRLFNGEKLSFSAANGKLSPTKGITIASENLVYIWGNYNTTGITGIPSGGSTTNDGGYTGPQIPSSIVCDAFFPLSKTWFDASSALYPEGSGNARNMLGEAYRMADEKLPTTAQSTSVRAGIIAGTNISGMTASPGRDAAGLRRNGGIINYPRFLELWNLNGVVNPWNYTGSFIPLYRSTQAISQWENETAIIYMPPVRNWSFDITFLTPQKLPPGTPFFQYVQATGFRQSLR